VSVWIFFLLMPNRARVVLEVDGQHHYANNNGKASPSKYAEMMAEDRKIRLRGYEVYRFGGQS
jgi:very-short-patch-repair endonuclease